MNVNVMLIDTEEKLKQAYEIWKKADVLGIDIECENNLHHYGASISIIQISSKTQNWIVDVLVLKKIPEVVNIFQDPNIVKIFHGSDFDLRMLNSGFKCKPKNIFDTQIAAQLIGMTEIGLGNLLEKYFNLNKIDKFQMADWTKRPLTEDMLEYATKDSKHLIKLRELLINELKQKNRLEWANQEFEYLENNVHKLHEPSFWDFKGLRKLTDKQRGVLKEIYELRETFAKNVNRPVHFIMNSKKMTDISINPPSFHDWKNMRGVHPIIRREASKLDKAVKKGLTKELSMPSITVKRFTKKQRDFLNDLNDIRGNVAQKIGIEPFLIMNKDQMYDIVLTSNLSSLRKWQKELVKEKIKFDS